MLAAGGGVLLLAAATAPMLKAAVSKPTAQPVPPAGAPRAASGFRPTPEQLQTMTLLTVASQAFDETRRANGRIAVDENRSTPVFSPYSGRVVQVLAEPGAWVRQGQPLFVVQASEFAEGRAALAGALAERAAAVAQLKLAQEAEQRAGEVHRTGGGALKDWRQAQSDLAAAESTERTAQAAVAAARSKLAILGQTPTQIRALETGRAADGDSARAVVAAPISGVVMQRAVGLGQNIGAGGDAPQFVIADTSRVWLVAQAAESDVATMRLGATVEVTTPAQPGRVFSARIDNVAPALDPETRRLAVRATLANMDGALKPGLSASFTIKTGEGGASPAVPTEAVIREGDTARLWVLAPDGILRARPVRTGGVSNGMVQIVSGLAPGERVVTRGALFIDEAGQGG